MNDSQIEALFAMLVIIVLLLFIIGMIVASIHDRLKRWERER